MKKCPPGIFCVENLTLGFTLVILCIFLYLSYLFQTNRDIKQSVNIHQSRESTNYRDNGYGYNYGFGSWFPSYPYNNLPAKDVLLNPYEAPYKDDRYFISDTRLPRGAVPINVSTNVSAVDTVYRQMGLLTPLQGSNKDNILPLMGRPLFVSRSKYQYYTISNQHNNIKLPLKVKGRSALNENGVDELFGGDTVFVEGYDEPFKITTYGSDTIKYLPFL